MKGIGIAALASTMWGVSGTTLQLISQNLAIPATWMLSVRTLVTGVILLVVSAFMYGKRIFNVFASRSSTISVVTYAIFGLMANLLTFYYAIQRGTLRRPRSCSTCHRCSSSSVGSSSSTGGRSAATSSPSSSPCWGSF